MNKSISTTLYLIAALFISFFTPACAESSFVTVNMGNGVTGQLPKNWFVDSDNKRKTLSAWAESQLEQKNLKDIENTMPFAASYYDENNVNAASMTIRFYPTLSLTQKDMREASSKDIGEVDSSVQSNFTVGIEAGGGKVIQWLGTSRREINGKVYLISRNRTINLKNHTFSGYLVRTWNGSKSFTLIMNYREDQEFFMKPIMSKMIDSIRY
jgi:hypothetical protein